MPTLNINNDVVLFPSANVGIKATPKAWASGYSVLNVGAAATISWTGAGANDFSLSTNAYYDATDDRWEYAGTGDGSARYSMTALSYEHRWYNAPVGTANAAISYTQAMTLTGGGNLLIGTTTDLGYKLFVNGSIVNQGNINSTGDPGLLIDTGQRLGFNESGVRSWTVKATGGNLAFNSGDGYGSFTFGASVTASSLIKSGGTSSQYLMADGSVSTIQTANVYTQTFFIPDTSGTAQWVKVGTWTAAQGGQVVTVEIAGHAGYNATTGQNQSVYIYMKTSNGSSVDPSGFAADSSFYTQGLNVAIGAGNVIWEANAAGVSATTYTLYVLFGQYTNGSQYTVTSRGGTWANVGTLTAPSGTTSSSTILLSEFRYSANNQLLTLDGNSSVLIGTTTNAGFKLDVDGTGRFTNLLQVNGPSGEARTDLHGISLYNANNDYRISLDTQSGTRGFIRYNVDTAGSTFHGHIFSAGDYNSSVTDLMLVRADGNVGIGTTSPAAKLQVELSGTVSLAAATIVKSTDFGASSRAGFSGLADNSDGIYFGMGANGTGIPAGFGFFREASGWNTALTFYTNNITSGPDSTAAMQEKMRITSAGNVGIGTTGPATKLEVSSSLTSGIKVTNSGTINGEAGIEAYHTGAQAGTAYAGYITKTGAGGTNVGIYTAASGATNNYGLIVGSGNVGIGTTAPAGKLSVEGDGTEYSNIVFKQSAAQEHLLYASTNFQYNLIGSGTPTWIWGQQGASERMRLNNTGLGIGTDAPQRPLHVNGTEGVLRLTSTASGNDGFEVGIGTSSQGFLWLAENSYIQFATNNAERMRITADGRLIIGRTTDSGAPFNLQVDGRILQTGQEFLFEGDNDKRITVYSARPLSFATSDTERMRITSGGNLYVGATGGARGSSTTRALIKLDSGQYYAELQAYDTSSSVGLLFSDGAGGNYGLIDYTATDEMLFYTASGERMRIDAAGNVGIGTDSPSHKLTVSRATEAAAYQININNDGGISNGNFTGIRFSQGAGGTTELGNIKLHYYSTGATDLSFGTRYDTQAIYIKNGGNVGIGTTSPVGKLDVALLNTRRFIVTYDDSLVTIKGASDTGAGENLRIIGDNLIFNTSSAGSGSERMRITSQATSALIQRHHSSCYTSLEQPMDTQ
jgi:hypothetical protein